MAKSVKIIPVAREWWFAGGALCIATYCRVKCLVERIGDNHGPRMKSPPPRRTSVMFVHVLTIRFFWKEVLHIYTTLCFLPLLM